MGLVLRAALCLLLLGLIPVRAEHGIRVLDAVYGTRHRACDASWAVEERCGGASECRVEASNHLCGDPDRGEVKLLTIRYDCPDGVRLAEVREGDVAFLACSRRGYGRDANPVDRRGRPGGLRIRTADYGIGRRYCDAAFALRSACEGSGACSVRVDNRLCGDPFEGKRKELFVEYSCGRDWRRLRFREGDVARLSCR